MIKLSGFPLFLFVFVGCSLSLDTRLTPWVEPGPGSFFFIQDLDETLGLLDPAEHGVRSHVATLGGAPNHLLFHGQILVVTNSLSGTLQSFTYSRTQGLSPGKKLFLGENKNPWMVVPAPTGGFPGKAYVPCWLSSELLVVDLDTLTLTGISIPTGPNPQSGVVIDQKAYVVNVNFDTQGFRFGNGSMTVVDTGTDQIIATVDFPQGINPQAVIPFPSRREIHVVFTGLQGENDGKVLIYHADSLELLKVVMTGGSPSWTTGGIDTSGNTVFLSGIGGLQAYNYQTGEVLGQESPQGTYLAKGSLSLDDLWSGAVYREDEQRIYLALSGRNKIVKLAPFQGSWVEEQSWDTLNYPKGNFLPLW